MFYRYVPVLLVFLLWFLPQEARAYTQTVTDDRPKIGLALSGGGAKGFVHIGVIKVLEEVGMPIDYISGTSMGALVGGLYAIGYSTDELTEIATGINWEDLFTDVIRRRSIPMEEKDWHGLYLLTLPMFDRVPTLPSGLVAGQRVIMLLNNLVWPYTGSQDFSNFPIPFVSVATDLETGELVVLRDGYLSEAIRASISMPSAIIPQRIDGRVLIDGGVVRNLPVEEAIELGADLVIAVDVVAELRKIEELKGIVEILDQTLKFQIAESVRVSRNLAHIHIESDTIRTYSVTDFNKAAELIKIGENAARAQYDKLKQLADSVNTIRALKPRHIELSGRNNDVFIEDIRFEGIQNVAEYQLRSRLLFSPGSYVSREQINEAIESIYGLMFFEVVNYKLIQTDRNDNSSYILQFEIIEKQQDLFRVGFNYNNIENASILLNTVFRNLLAQGSSLRFSLKLGEEPYIDVNYFRLLGLESNLSLNLRANYSHNKIDLFNNSGDRFAQYNTNALYLEGLFLPFSTNKLQGGLGFRAEFFDVSRRVGEIDFPSGASNILQALGILRQDNLDRLHFPLRGHRLHLRAAQSFKLFDNSLDFFLASMEWDGFFQLSDSWVLQSTVSGGLATRTELPLHHQFYLGGYPDLVGFRKYEVSSHMIRKAGLGLQFEFLPNNFIEVKGNMASTADVLDFDFRNNPLRIGWSAAYGLNTIIGPLKFALMSSQRNPFMIYYSFGAEF